jgi:hypothetical protein
MSVRSTVLALLALAFGSMGCNKNVFFSSAPAKAGWIYVVGSKNDRAQLWLCPATPGKGQCQEVDVVEVDR